MGIELAAAFIRGRHLNAGRCLIEEICYITGIHTRGEDLGYPPKSIPPPNPFSIDIIWPFPGGTCPQTPLGVESPPQT